jgi:hypothetical protein
MTPLVASLVTAYGYILPLDVSIVDVLNHIANEDTALPRHAGSGHHCYRSNWPDLEGTRYRIRIGRELSDGDEDVPVQRGA